MPTLSENLRLLVWLCKLNVLEYGIWKMGDPKVNKRKPERCGRTLTVGKTTDIPAGRSAKIILSDRSQIALFNNDGRFCAVENFCPHKGYLLTGSRIRKGTIECRHHGWQFDVATGECLTKKSCSVEVYEVLIDNDRIKIKL